MEKTYRYFQPEYVGNFKCDGAKCKAHCCKFWKIFIDKDSREQYANIEPPETAQEITSCMELDSEQKLYAMKLKPNGFCPMLTENNLCRLQRDYGENFLSITCSTYPRITNNFGDFFERALTLSCPVAAEQVLFDEEPIRFGFVNVPEKIHSNGGKIRTGELKVPNSLAERAYEVQGTMIQILQERRLTVNQRLIVLGLFLDTLQEMLHDKISAHELRKLTSAYNPKIFLRDRIPPVIQKVSFRADKFIALMLKLFEPIYRENIKSPQVKRKYFDAVVDMLKINSSVSLEEVIENYVSLADARKTFRERYASFMENYLVNEIFINVYPWKLNASINKNFAVLLATYKLFELIIFSATIKGFDSRADLLSMVDWFTRKIDHGQETSKKILELFKDEDDTWNLLETLLEQ